MTIKTFEKKIKSLHLNKNSSIYVTLNNLNCNEIRTCRVVGRSSGRHYVDLTEDFFYIFDKLKIPYTFLNDSPRGGKCGNLIILRTLKF